MPKNDHTTLQVLRHNPATPRISDNRSPHTPPDETNSALLMPVNSHHILRRRRSHLKRWMEDQQFHAHIEPDDIVDDAPETPVERIGTPCNPYLAYPHLSAGSYHSRTLNEVGSMHNYVVIDDALEDEASADEDHVSVDSDGAEHMSPPATPAINVSPQTSSSPKKRIGTSSLRNFRISIRSAIPAISLSGEPSASRNSSRLSLFRSHRRSSSTVRSNSKHNKSSSLSTLNLPPQGIPSEDSARITASQSSSWRWRASMRGHISSPQSQVLNYESHAPRPSMSSSHTYTSVLTPPATNDDEDADLLSTPSKTVHLNSIRSRGKSPTRALFQNGPGTASVPSLWSGPTSISHTPEASGSTSALAHKDSAIRIPFSSKGKRVTLTPTSTEDDSQNSVEHSSQCPQVCPQVVYLSAARGSIPRASLSSLSSSRDKRKKKLVVNGIGVHEPARLEAMKKWCESFGEVTQIMRMPNGELHVHFRKVEVAETVCRVRARVNISGVGSVQLSWFTGDKR